MLAREYIRLCKQAGCGQEFVASASSLDQDRSIGFSEPEYCPKHRALHARSYSRIACHHYDIELTSAGEDLIRNIEQHKIAEGLKTEDLRGTVFNPWAMPAKGLGPGGLGCFQRPLRAFVENSNYQPRKIAFQIAEKGEEIWEALEDHQVVVLVGTTGSGKSTYVPWLLLTGGEPGQLSKWARRGPICVTQPRIQATRQVPAFIANALNGTSLGIGSQIGFSHAKADEYDRRTRLIFKTDGKLINDIVSGAVADYSIVVIDEAHERSVNIDLILGLLKDQLYLYPHLRVIIASATIDHESFIGFFGGESRVPYIYSEGRRFTITPHWWGDPEDDWWKRVNQGQQPTRDQHPYAVAELTRNLCLHLDSLSAGNAQELSHILAFLPGTREIDQTVSLINAYGMPNVVAMPLYSRRPLDEQQAALNPDPEKHSNVYGKRRVVVSTNVAETSLTVEGVRYVIDTGYIKQSYWNPITEVSELQTVRHSQAGCRQRWGRAGRISEGHAYKLYTKAQFEDGFPTDSTPDIARSSLEEVLLSAKAAGVRTIRGKSGLELDFDWMPLSQPSDQKRFKTELTRAFVSLTRQGAINEDGDLTRFGLELRGMPAAINVTRIFTEGERHGMGIEVATLLPFLKLAYGIQMILLWKREWDSYTKLAIRQRHLDFIYGCQDDLDLYFKLWTLWEERTQKQRQDWEEEAGISFKGFQENIEEERRRLIESTKDWRKAEKRQVAIEKLDALRALIAHCLQEEIYLPIEESQNQQSTESGDSRLRMPDILPWESYWEGAEQEAEDEEVVFDPNGAMKVSSRSGVYRRLGKSSRDSDESALIEISPTSICFGADSGDPLLACQRRANFRRPARAKVMGMNMIRIKREWMKEIEGSLVQRTLLYSSLARRGDQTKQQEMRNLLFLPWLVPRGMKVSGKVCDSKPNQGTLLDLQITLSTNAIAKGYGKRLSIQGWIRTEATNGPLPEQGQEITAEITGYSVDEFGEPFLLLVHCSASKPNYHAFAKRYRNDTSVKVEMRKVLEDPLGRSPMFIVRDCSFGLDIPMSDSDFCGNTHPQSYFGRRFEIGEHFELEVEKTYADRGLIYLSRARHLLQEYAGIPYQDQSCIEVTVSRVDPLGVFLVIPPSGYVGFVRRPLWPDGFDPKPGDKVRARLRRFDRHVNVKQMMEYLKEGHPLPEELDLGVELDLRIPPAYDRFREQHQVGDLINIAAEKALDSGSLLVTLNRDLKGIVYESELDLDSQGRLKRARDYEPGELVTARIYQMLDAKAMVRCSLFRKIPIPESLQIGQTLEVVILMIREDQQEPDQLWLTCGLNQRHQVQVRASAQGLDSPLVTGEIIHTTVQKLDRRTSSIQGSLVERML